VCNAAGEACAVAKGMAMHLCSDSFQGVLVLLVARQPKHLPEGSNRVYAYSVAISTWLKLDSNPHTVHDFF
jgi:hypothetical protein